MSASRSEGVGSLLRTPELLDARRRHDAGELDHAAFKRIEDGAVIDAIRLQEEVGIGVVTDGELRRRGWMSHFVESVEGLRAGAGPSLPWRGVDGELPPELRGGMRPVVVEPLRWRHSACAEEWTFLRGHSDRPAKVTMVSAEMAAALYEPDASGAAYPTREAYFADVVELLRREVAEVVRLGATYVQLDAPQYGALLDPATREVFRARGSDPDAMIDAGIELDNAVIAGFPGVTFGLHICRGNNQSRYYAEGDYGPLTRLFERSAFERLLLEYDDERSGGFEPLAAVPEDRTVVLGLLTTKRPGLEHAEDLKRRIAEAAAYVPLERLALSPQCGFASMMEGNAITIADQRRTLERVVEVARAVWG
ncbi:MAG: cobalamin-independent methionine synthase II family protein [Solirubrobacteraceae bacterium]